MTVLWYIARKSVKNSVREILKKPGKLTLYLLVIAALIAVALLSFYTERQIENTAALFWFSGILFLFIGAFFVNAVVKGLASGDVIFEMNDVNLLFVSPLNPRKILIYGILRLIKVSFFAGFFILFQANTLALFGIGYSGVLLTLLGFMLSMIALSAISLLIYSVSNGSAKRKSRIRLIALCLFLPAVFYAATQFFLSGDIYLVLERLIQSPFITCIPVTGWTAAGITALVAGKTATGLLWLGADLLLIAIILVYLILSNPDYYEDVLIASETAFEKKRALAEGNINAAAFSAKKIKVNKTGIRGLGASAFLGKHIRESFRQNRWGFLNLFSAFTVAGGVVFSLIVKDLMLLLQILMWIQILAIGTGRGLVETYSHYIYLVPESSFKKIIWSNMEVMVRTLLEAALIFGVSGVLLKLNYLPIITCAITYTLFSFLLLGVNYLFMRFFSADLSKGLLLLIYYLAIILIMLPGIVLAIIVGGDGAWLIGLGVLALWELAAGIICFFLSKGILHNCDMLTLKK
jgi:hypothetical protein